MKFCPANHILQQQDPSTLQDENRPPNVILSNPDKPTTPSLPEGELYKDEIYAHVLAMSHPPSEPNNYFPNQPDLGEHMRGVLLSWLQQVHQKYKLMTETFFLTVRIIDSYLKEQIVSRNKLQLVGIASLWIAAKYHETYQVPKLTNLEHLCDNAYKSSDILSMEGSILATIGFDLLVEPTAFTHLQIIQNDACLQPRDYWLARYLLEASTFQLSLQRFSPALLAYSVVFFLKKMRGYVNFQEQKLRALIGGQDQEIRIIGRQLCSLWHRAEQQDNLSPLRSKFSQKQFYEVSKIRLAERTR